MKTKTILLAIAYAMVACAPMTKDDYMAWYSGFITEVSENAASYTENDWLEHDEQFHEYSEVLYQQFQDELTPSDKLTLAGYKVKYSYYRNLCKSGNWLMDAVNSLDVESAVSGIKSLGNELIDAVNHANE